MLVSEYIASFFAERGIHDIFGYPGGMVTYLMDALDRHSGIRTHLCYHEQGAAFAACGYGMTKGIPGVAYATSGPGATNLLTGVANAYFDSTPAIFLTGQVNTYDMKQGRMRQRGFQETDIVSISRPVTKAALKIMTAEQVPQALEKLYDLSMSGRKGPVLLDLPMDVQRSEWKDMGVKENAEKEHASLSEAVQLIRNALQSAKRPLVLAGAGIRQGGALAEFQAFIRKFRIPVVTSMVAVDILKSSNSLNLGFLGAYGHRWANMATEKADFILSLGSRMDSRQIGSKKDWFAPHARVLRVDIDAEELAHTVKAGEETISADLKILLEALTQEELSGHDWEAWRNVCRILKEKLRPLDGTSENEWVREISRGIPADAVVTTDVGQNQVWVAQSFEVRGQRILFSGGHGAMGFSLPAAIGACIASGGKPVYAFCGDGGFQMNLQELQVIVREKLPIKIILMNNHSLGMIRHFQEMYFDGNYVQTKPERGYTVPDFVRIAEAYEIPARRITSLSDFGDSLCMPGAILFDIQCRENTYVFPKLAVHKPIYDQEPLMPRELLEELNQL